MSSLNDESFYNILGEEISRNGLVQQMINFYGLLLEVGETRITDFNEGSEIRNFLETIAVDHYVILEDQNEHAKITFIDTAYGVSYYRSYHNRLSFFLFWFYICFRRHMAFSFLFSHG